MKRSLLASLLIWIFTIQAAMAFSPKDSDAGRKNVVQAIANYNTFASNPTKEASPSYLPSESIKYIKDYMGKNKITGPLPQVKPTNAGGFELTMEGQTILVNIDPVLGVIWINGNSLVLKSGDDFKSRLEQIKKFLTAPKSAFDSKKYPHTKNRVMLKLTESLFSLIVSNAEADCSTKLDEAIQGLMPKRDGIYLFKHPELWAFASWALYSAVIIGTAGSALVPFALAGGTVMLTTVPGTEREIIKKEDAVKNQYSEYIAIEGAYNLAKTGKVPPSSSTKDRPYTENETRFLYLYDKYSSYVKKTGGVPLSQEEFMKTLASGDSNEKFCSSYHFDNAVEIAQKIVAPAIDPNVVNKSVAPEAAIVDESRKDTPKPADAIGSEQKTDASAAVQK